MQLPHKKKNTVYYISLNILQKVKKKIKMTLIPNIAIDNTSIISALGTITTVLIGYFIHGLNLFDGLDNLFKYYNPFYKPWTVLPFLYDPIAFKDLIISYSGLSNSTGYVPLYSQYLLPSVCERIPLYIQIINYISTVFDIQKLLYLASLKDFILTFMIDKWKMIAIAYYDKDISLLIASYDLVVLYANRVDTAYDLSGDASIYDHVDNRWIFRGMDGIVDKVHNFIRIIRFLENSVTTPFYQKLPYYFFEPD